MTILAIDTSCDETSVAVTCGREVLSNVISSQVRQHRRFGGVVPFLAQRLHRERIDAVITLALERAHLSWSEIDALAVTEGPGLAPALEVGIQKAKDLSQTHSLPLYAVDHMAGHLASCFVGSEVPLPTLALLVSGKHSELVLFERFGRFTLLGQTLDDAVGEAYDKVARMLGLGYPGGRLVSKLAKLGDPEPYPLPVPMAQKGNLNFSFSGLKNAVRLLVLAHPELTPEVVAGIAASFERSAQASLLRKLEWALREHPEVKSLLVAGGVAANLTLRRAMRRLAKQYGMKLLAPLKRTLCMDNAAMIGVAAFLGIEQGQVPVNPETLERKPSLSLDPTFRL